jgi:hypothetical protein
VVALTLIAGGRQRQKAATSAQTIDRRKGIPRRLRDDIPKPPGPQWPAALGQFSKQLQTS